MAQPITVLEAWKPGIKRFIWQVKLKEWRNQSPYYKILWYALFRLGNKRGKNNVVNKYIHALYSVLEYI